MKIAHYLKTVSVALGAVLLSACAHQSGSKPYDYAAFRESRPASILVLPPLNESPEVKASAGMLSRVTFPLAESGYYVFPVALVDEVFRQNGLTSPADIHAVSLEKLRSIFGADAVLYIKVTEYGTTYKVIASETRVAAEGRLVDARTGAALWSGQARASSAETQNNSSGGLIGALVTALMTQIADTLNDRGVAIAGLTSLRLLSAGTPNGILYGPRSPKYQKDGSPAP